MPLLDHFNPPLFPGRRWESFHAVWASEMVARLNREVLPSGFFAETQIHIGSRVEVDVATMEDPLGKGVRPNGPGGTATLAAEVWAPPAPSLVMPTVFPDEIEVEIYGTTTGAHLVAAVELVSPGNKDRPETRRAFAAKCAAYLQLGIGLVIVDVVTDRQANLHDELLAFLAQEKKYRLPEKSLLYAVAYRPARRDPGGDQIDIWPASLSLGQGLPIMALALRGGPTLPLDLEVTYSDARNHSRL